MSELCLLGYPIMTIPVWDKFGHKSGRLFHLNISSKENPDTQEDLSQPRVGQTRHSGDESGAKREGREGKMFSNLLVAVSREALCLAFVP